MDEAWDRELGDGDGADPEERQRALSAEDDLAAFAPVESVRSPVHKALFKERNAFFDRYAEAFRSTSLRRLEQLRAAQTKEDVGEKNWQSMLLQLTKGEAA